MPHLGSVADAAGQRNAELAEHAEQNVPCMSDHIRRPLEHQRTDSTMYNDDSARTKV
jgi:hypothetical protein